MFSWLEYEIRGMSETDYLLLYGILSAALLALLYYSFNTFRRFRFMAGTATSKIRSAAQGHVELKGLAEFMQDDSILSPFSGSRCVWYHCTIDKKKSSGKRTTWTNISDQCSGHLFRLLDDTGECVIDPDHARVIAETDRTWYGDGVERTAPPSKTGLISFGAGKYRFRERLIRPATSIYAMGWFRTVYNNLSDEFISEQVEDLVKQWQLQPQRYLQDFDFDQNGKIQQGEWKAIRAAARKQVMAEISRQKTEHHILSKPREKHMPFILSAIAEEALVARKKQKAYASVATAMVIFSGLVFMFTVRAPFLI